MTVLVTGFEGYGGRPLNPSEELARSLDGVVIAGELVEARRLAVDLRTVGPAIRAAIEETAPTVVVCLGLWPGSRCSAWSGSPSTKPTSRSPTTPA